MEKISEHISYSEATKSQQAERLGISNKPNSEQLEAMKLVANNVFEVVRNHFNVPIGISSFFRNAGVNAMIGGARNSQHCIGEAIDIDADIFGGVTNKQIFDYIRKNLVFDQLIWEFGDDESPAWVHVSLKKNDNRKQVLKAKTVQGKTIYKEI